MMCKVYDTIIKFDSAEFTMYLFNYLYSTLLYFVLMHTYHVNLFAENLKLTNMTLRSIKHVRISYKYLNII